MQWEKWNNEHNFEILLWFKGFKFNAFALSLVIMMDFMEMNDNQEEFGRQCCTL
jgi:hypothetical protein